MTDSRETLDQERAPLVDAEWRVRTKIPGTTELHYEDVSDEKAAREWADSERAEYAGATVTIERRQVSRWMEWPDGR